MAIIKKVKVDKIEIVGDFDVVQVRERTSFIEDGEEVSASFHRITYSPVSNISGASVKVQNICNLLHTDAVKAAFIAEEEKIINV